MRRDRPPDSAIIRNAVTNTSRKAMTPTAHQGTCCGYNQAREKKVPSTSTLSAMGSRKRPSRLFIFSARAAYPSAKSDSAPRINRAKASECDHAVSLKRQTMTKGVTTMRNIVMALGMNRMAQLHRIPHCTRIIVARSWPDTDISDAEMCHSVQLQSWPDYCSPRLCSHR